MIAKALKKGDKIGVIAPCDPLGKNDIEYINKSILVMEKAGFRIEFGKYTFDNDWRYSNSTKKKVEDINSMFENQEIKAIFIAKGGFNSNSTLDYIDYNLIKNNPKILCGYSDSTSLINAIHIKTGLVTFHGPNFKSISSSETDYEYKCIINNFVEGNKNIGQKNELYETIQEGEAQGELIGGNLSLISRFCSGKYEINFTDKILFIEDLGVESQPGMVSNYLYHMKQNKVFDKIKGIWLGNYESDTLISLEKILKDVIENEYKYPIIKSNNFGHGEKKAIIPIGTKAKINTNQAEKVELIEACIEK